MSFKSVDWKTAPSSSPCHTLTTGTRLRSRPVALGPPGADDELDPQRFGTWLEVLLEAGETVAAQKLAGIDAELVIAALAQHVRVFDRAAISASDGEDAPEPDGRHSDSLSYEIGGYVIEPRRQDVWSAIVTVLISLESDQPDYFHRVMSGCRRLSNAGWELDGLDDLLSDPDQEMFDLAVDREGRREQQGFVPPAQARAFLRSAREIRLNDPDATAKPTCAGVFRWNGSHAGEAAECAC